VAAGIALVLLGIMLDRMTHGTGRRATAPRP
jgi:ABC-type proline/glycine betaine transport system permease subunit